MRPRWRSRRQGRAAQGHQHHGRAQEEHAGEGSSQGQGRGAEAHGKGCAETAHYLHITALETITTPNCSLIFAGADKLPAHINAETTRIFRVEYFDHHPRRAVEHHKSLKRATNTSFGGGDLRDCQLNTRHVGSTPNQLTKFLFCSLYHNGYGAAFRSSPPAISSPQTEENPGRLAWRSGFLFRNQLRSSRSFQIQNRPTPAAPQRVPPRYGLCSRAPLAKPRQSPHPGLLLI